MTKNNANKLNRRKFLGYSALGMTGLTILPNWVMANGLRISPSDRIVLGFIGLGQQGMSDFMSFTPCAGVQVAAGCDVDGLKNERFKRRVHAWQKNQNVPQRCDTYEFYEDLLNRKDIDAVSIATPDHWHALNTIHACQAKKDVYVQKPLSYSISESIDMVRAVRDNKCVVQVGSQQRSSKEFQQAIAVVRAGGIGHIETIHVKVGPPPSTFDLPEMPIPPELNFNQWLGPLNDPKVHYHPDICLPISLDPEKNETKWACWRYYRETANGFTADWGTHMFDIAQAAIGMDGLGPCEYIPAGFGGAKYLTMKYQNGIVMTEQPYHDKRTDNGISFNGTKGWLKVARGFIDCSDSSLLKKQEQQIGAGQFEMSSPHMQNFLDCVRSRKNPIAPVEAGASSLRICCLANMSIELQRPVKWDPATLCFDGDMEAANHRLYRYQYRKPYTI